MENQLALFQEWIESQRLLAVQVLVPRKGRQSFVGRLLQFDAQSNRLLFYDQDRKQVWNALVSEIDNIEPFLEDQINS